MKLLLAALIMVALAGCVQLTINGDNNTTMIEMSTMGTATIPVSAIPGLP